MKNSETTRATILSIIIITIMLVSGTLSLPRANAAKPPTLATFLNYELAGNTFATPGFSVGVTCPNTSGTCQSTEGEPQIRADRSGGFYASSESTFCVIGGQCGGTFAWKSTDGGNHFTTLPLPNSVSAGGVGISPAGGDTDIAVAPVKNANGFYNIYVASLQSRPPLLDVYVSTSKDGGASWSINPTGASIPVDDREWIAADGANKVCLSYHAQPATNTIVVDCSYDAGATFTQHASSFDANHIAFLAGFNNIIGNLAIDPRNHVIYQTFSSIATLPELASCTIACHVHTVWIAVSIDGGNSFTDYTVYNNPDVNVDYGHQFINVSVDDSGNVYAVYTDNHNVFYSFSTSFGQAWFGPYQINNAPSATAIMPWSSAAGKGGLDVVWYGSSYYDGVNPPDTYPDTATWQVYFAQNLQALTPNGAFTQVAASGTIHYGAVCESGVTCTGNRDLLDDFGVAASPTTGLAAIVYTDDQFVNSALEPATVRNSGSAVCDASTTNTVDCSHTNIAVQTGGSGLKQLKHHFETSGQDFEQRDLSLAQPSFTIQGTNTGTTPITSINLQISGQPLSLTWNTAFPLQPGQYATATTTTLPLGLVPVVGQIYTITTTATMADGTTETQADNSIYTLGAGLGL